jgi:uncharacterized protein (TIGR02284 family)
MENEKTIDVLNTLITINNDRIEGYKTASEETEEMELKSLFAGFISTSEKCKSELVAEVNKLGGEVADGTKISGKFFRVWMDVKAALTGKDRKAILNSGKFGEEEAKETYKSALEENLEYLTSEHQNMISAQKELLKADRKHIKALRAEFADS